MGVGPPKHRFFSLWFYKESTLQNHTLTPRDEGYKIIMEHRWTYGQLDGLDFVKGPDPGWGGQNGPREIFEPILVDFEVDFIRIHIVSNIFPW